MTENRFKNGQYEDALQYTKDILNSSLSMEDIIDKSNINLENNIKNNGEDEK